MHESNSRIQKGGNQDNLDRNNFSTSFLDISENGLNRTENIIRGVTKELSQAFTNTLYWKVFQSVIDNTKAVNGNI